MIRCLGKDICDMKQTIKSTLVRSVRSSSERLQRAIETHAYLLASSYQLSDHNSSIPLPINGFSKSNQLAEFKRENEEEGEMNSQRILSVSWESTAALSLATFTSLLIEFVARLDHLVEAVHHLSQMAKFQHESL